MDYRNLLRKFPWERTERSELDKLLMKLCKTDLKCKHGSGRLRTLCKRHMISLKLVIQTKMSWNCLEMCTEYHF